MDNPINYLETLQNTIKKLTDENLKLEEEKKDYQYFLLSLITKEKDNQNFLLSLIVEEKESINKIRMFKYLVENLEYHPSKEEVVDILTKSLREEEQANFYSYVKTKFPDYAENVYNSWVAYGKEREKIMSENY